MPDSWWWEPFTLTHAVTKTRRRKNRLIIPRITSWFDRRHLLAEELVVCWKSVAVFVLLSLIIPPVAWSILHSRTQFWLKKGRILTYRYVKAKNWFPHLIWDRTKLKVIQIITLMIITLKKSGQYQPGILGLKWWYCNSSNIILCPSIRWLTGNRSLVNKIRRAFSVRERLEMTPNTVD